MSVSFSVGTVPAAASACSLISSAILDQPLEVGLAV
jgi:hypothetical protein